MLGGRRNDGEADKGLLSPPGQHLSVPTDVHLLPNMNQLCGLSRDSEGKTIPGQNLDSSPLLLALSERDEGKGTTLEQEPKQRWDGGWGGKERTHS